MRKCTPFTLLKTKLIAGNTSTMYQTRMFTSFAPKANVQCLLLPHLLIPSSLSSFAALPLTSNVALVQQHASLSTRSGKNNRRGKKLKLRRTNGLNTISGKNKADKASSTHSAETECDGKLAKDQHAKKKLTKEKIELHCLLKEEEEEDEATSKKEFCRMWHECFSIPCEEFLLGAHQAYYTVGGALKLIDCELPNTKVAERPFYSHDNAIQVFADVIKDKFDIESSELLDNTETINDEERMEEERQCLKEIASNCNIWHFDMSATSASWRDKVSFHKFMQQIVPVFNSFLPCSIAFTHSIFQLWWAQHLRMYNLRSIAGPTDYIMASEIVLFAELESSKKMKEKNGEKCIDPRGKRQEAKENKAEHEREKCEVAEEESTNADIPSNTTTIRIEPHDSKGEATCINVVLPMMWWNNRSFTDRKYVIPEWNGTLKELMRHVEQMRVKEHNTETTEVEIELPEVTNDSTSSSSSSSSMFTDTTTHSDNTDTVGKHKSSSDNTDKQENTTATKDTIHNINDNNSNTKKNDDESNGTFNSIEFCEEHNSYRVKVNRFTEFYAPQDALALVVVMLDVVIPPARKFDEYDTMYSFTGVLKSAFKRATVARYLAAMGLSRVLTMQDYFVRLLTGESFKDTYIKASLPLMDLPVDSETHVPTVRKYLCLYMDAAKQWNVSSILERNPLNYTKSTSL